MSRHDVPRDASEARCYALGASRGAPEILAVANSVDDLKEWAKQMAFVHRLSDWELEDGWWESNHPAVRYWIQPVRFVHPRVPTLDAEPTRG